MADTLKGIKTRIYSNFRGVDFTEGNISDYRSPDALNMWKNYKDDDCVQTRPGMQLLNTFSGAIYGLFFYKVNNVTQVLVHINTKMYRWTNYPTSPATITELYSGLNPKEGKSFISDNIFYFLDGINYLEYDGSTMKAVEGTIPITTYWRTPDGSTPIDSNVDTDLVYQDVNVLTPKRINRFIGDGESTEYHLDDKGLDSKSTYLMSATIGGIEKTEDIDFTTDRTTGIVTFNSAPSKNAEVYITYSKTIANQKNRILNCTLLCEFDNRVFFSGNPDYPNTVFHCELNNPRYIRDIAYYECGLDLAPVKAIIPGNGVLWVLKEINQNTSSVYYLTPTIDENYNKIYPANNGSISFGCVSTGINFHDDIVFFSTKGLEGISSSQMYSEQILQHKSSLVDNKMLSESGYKSVKLAEWEGYLLCLINSHIYLADSRQRFQNNSNDIEYEWFYWELPNTITYIKEYHGDLYLGNASGKLFKLTGTKDVTTDISSYWTTKPDDYNYPGYTKTTNKRGNVIYFKTMNNDGVQLSTIVDGVEKEKSTLSDANGVVPFRIKDKKFKKIQVKVSSNNPFGLFSITTQGFIAGYVKK